MKIMFQGGHGSERAVQAVVPHTQAGTHTTGISHIHMQRAEVSYS